MPENFSYKDYISEEDWELLVSVFVNFIGRNYLLGKSGFTIHQSHELINELTESITSLAERVKTNLPEGRNVPIDAFVMAGSLSVAFDEIVLRECCKDFCISSGIDYKQALNYHKTARSKEQARVYGLLKDHIVKEKVGCTVTLVALGRPGSKEASFLNKSADGSSERTCYASTFLDYWSLSMVLTKLDANVTRKVVGRHQLVFDILGVMPQGSGVLLNFYVA